MGFEVDRLRYGYIMGEEVLGVQQAESVYLFVGASSLQPKHC
jgi:hypothetical protein